MSHFSTANRLTPLLTTLALLSSCTEDSPGGLTEAAPSSSGSIDTATDSSSGGSPPTSEDPFVTDPVNPDSSVTNVTTGDGTTGDGTTGDPSTTSTTVDVTATTTGDGTTGDGTTTTGAGTTTTGDTSGDDTTGDDTSGDGTTGCGEGDPLCAVPPEEQVPTPKPDGVPGPLPGVYDDQGVAPADAGFRALIGFPTRDRVALEARVVDLYDPAHPDFRKYMTTPEWMAGHAPPQADFDLIKAWLVSRNLQVNYEASNRLLIAFSGSVADFNATFQTTLHVCLRKNPQQGNPPFEVYCTLESFKLPKFVADRTTGLLTADLPADIGALPAEAGAVISDPPGPGAYSPAQIAGAYEVDDLYAAGFNGQGVKLGVIAAATFHGKDLQTFWKSFNITRAAPKRVQVMEPVITRITETILDTQWSSAIAPGAEVITYEGPDARNTALLYVFNEAIAANAVSVLTDSFAHREDSEPQPLRHQYDHSALMGAALGMTVISASGDSGRPDTPCSSPYVTCVGGTRLTLDPLGGVLAETAWQSSGSGDAKTFNTPAWQQGVVPGTKRAMVDVALNASPATAYWVRRLGSWSAYGGTSFSAPVFAGLVAVVNSYRASKGLPAVGYLNPTLYTDLAVRASFRDVVLGGTDLYDAKVGWDYPTGWGAPRAMKLADALP